MEAGFNFEGFAPLTKRDYAYMKQAADFVRRSAEEWYIKTRRSHGHSRLMLEPVVLKPSCDDCLSRFGMRTFLERALSSRKDAELIPVLPLEVWPDRLRMYDRSARLIHLLAPDNEQSDDWYGIRCSDCHQRMDSKTGDDIICVYEVPFADYFGFPDPEASRKNLRGAARRREQERILALYGGRCFECDVVLKIGKTLTLDHILARSSGGTWHTTNLQPLCEGCQAKKADLPVEVIPVALDMLLRRPPSDTFDGPVW